MKHIYIIVATCYIIHQSCTEHIMMGERGDYSGIWVGFSRRIETEDKKQLLQDLKSILSEASKELYKVTEGRAYFKEIIFIIPQSWGEEENWKSADENNVSKAGLERFNEADIFIEAENGFFGRVPYTIQAAGCEQQGLGIYIPETFLQQQRELSAQEKAQTLVYQWMKYRYGIFDEHGFHGDDRYPVLHGRPGDSEYKKVTSCANHDLQYEHLDESDQGCLMNKSTGRLNDATCHVNIIQRNPPDQSSSFMFSPKMSKLCGSGDNFPHDVSSPTKHNALCFERSISVVVSKHKDLKESHGVILQNTTFHYVQERKLHLLLAVDRTVDTSEFELHKLLRRIVPMFLDLSLPRDHLVKLLFYDSFKTVEADFQEGWSYPTTDDTGSGNILSALRDSLRILEEYRPVEGSIFLLIAKRTLHDDEITLLSEMATVKKIRVNVVFCLTDEVPLNPMAKSIAGTGINIQNIPLKKDSFVYWLHSALQTSLHGDTFGMRDDNIFIMQKYFISSGNYVNFTFPVDETTKQDVRILLSTVDASNIYDDRTSISFTTGSKKMEPGTEYRFLQNYQSGLKVVKILKEVVGDISVSIGKRAGVPLEVLVVAKESNSISGIIVRSWMNHTGQFITVNSGSYPVILYTEVRSGNFPVQNANVKANLYHRSRIVSSFSLIDDGNGDPDITRGDGIYSSYMTRFSTEGDYILQISVDDDGKAEIVKKTGRDGTCCGSFIPAEESVLTGSFRRLYTHGSFFVSIPSDHGNDFYPPSRITDFMVTDVFSKSSDKAEDVIYVTFSFSAPGGDYNHGQASGYELSYSNYRQEVKSFKNETISDPIDAVMPQGKKYGEKAEFKFEMPQDKLKRFRSKNIRVVYFAVRAVDRGNNIGQTSNIVEVQLPPPPPPTINPFLSSTLKPGQDGSGNQSAVLEKKDDQGKTSSSMIIGIVVGIIGLIILAVVVVLFLLARGKKTRRLKDNNGSLENNKVSKEYLPDNVPDIPTKLSNPISPIQSWPADVLLDHYDKVQETKNKKNSSNDSLNSSSSDSSRPLKPNPVYETFNKDGYGGDNSGLPSAPYSSSQSSLSQTRSVTQV